MISGAAFHQGLFFGIAAAMPIGPINIEIIRRGLVHHPLQGQAIGCGAVVADVTYLTIAFLGVGAAAMAYPHTVSTLQGAGAVLLFGLGAMAWRAPVTLPDGTTAGVHEASPTVPQPTGGLPPIRSFLATLCMGFLMTLLNPMTLLTWVALSAHVLAAHNDAASTGGTGSIYAGLALGTMCGAGGWTVLLCSALYVARGRIPSRLLHVLNPAGGACLMAFGAVMLADLLARTMPH